MKRLLESVYIVALAIYAALAFCIFTLLGIEVDE